MLMKTKRCFTVMGAAAFPLIVALMLNGSGCKKEETEAVPTPVPTPTPTPTPVTAVVPEEDAGIDAGEDAADAADAKKPTGSFDPSGIKKCCAALRGNAKSAPLDQQPGYLAAAAACDGMAASAQGQQGLGSLRSFLRGASLPAGCQ
jgi:hypothetical protein